MKASSSSTCCHDTDHDRRRFHRYASEPLDIQIHSGSRTVRGQLVNESIGGLAMFTHDASNILVGQQVETSLRDGKSTAYVRSVRPAGRGKYRISVSWEKKVCTMANAHADYLVHDDLALVCEILCDQAGPVRTIRLWDGAEFDVPAEDVCSRSFEQRRDELHETPTKLPVLAQIYGLSVYSDTHAMVSEILDFEFSSQFDTSGDL